jgi:ATP-dependent DNA ligase
VASDDNGVAVFARLRRKPSGRHVFLIAFDLLELDGELALSVGPDDRLAQIR